MSLGKFLAVTIVDGMSEWQIARCIAESGAPAVFDARIGIIRKTIPEIMKDYYDEQNRIAKEKARAVKDGLLPDLPDTGYRPPKIKIE